MAAGAGAAAGGRSFSFKVVLLGEGCVGKTSLVLRYCENKFNDKHITTLQVRAGPGGEPLPRATGDGVVLGGGDPLLFSPSLVHFRGLLAGASPPVAGATRCRSLNGGCPLPSLLEGGFLGSFYASGLSFRYLKGLASILNANCSFFPVMCMNVFV